MSDEKRYRTKRKTVEAVHVTELRPYNLGGVSIDISADFLANAIPDHYLVQCGEEIVCYRGDMFRERWELDE